MSNSTPNQQDVATARDWYNRLSGIYDRLADSSERPPRVQGLRLLNPQPGESHLEVGYGTGQAILSLAHAVGPQGRVVGVDVSEGMQKVAQTRVDQEGVKDWVNLEVGDAHSLPFKDAEFDGVFSSFTLELFPNEEIPSIVAEFLRVLKPQGRVVIVSLAKEAHQSVSTKIYEKMHAWFPRYVDCHPIDVEGSLLAGGFRVETSEPFSMWGIPGRVVLARKP